jgi:UPF0755 protein
LRKAFIALLCVIVGVALYVYFTVNPLGPRGSPATISIPEGTSTSRIAHLLAKDGVVHNATLFELYAKLFTSKPLLAGTYQLPTNESYGEVLAALQRGPVTKKLVVPDGFTLHEIAAALAALHVGISARAFLSATEAVRSPYEPAGTHDLEGLLFPATYPVAYGQTATSLVRYMVSTFDLHAGELGLASAAAKLHLSPYQVVTVASIVQREAGLGSDRGPVASVIYNRLERGLPIGVESTLVYGLGGKIPTDLTVANPYNTFTRAGLPPTPISSPGLASLEAAMHPPETPYLYFVEVNPDGKMGFGTTEAQFRQLERQCRAVHLC